MRSFPFTLLILIAAVLLDVSIMPIIAVLGLPVSLVAIGIASVALVGFLDLALFMAVIGGALLDILAATPFGLHSLPLLILWGVLAFGSRYRLIAPWGITLLVTMGLTGFLFGVVHGFLSSDWVPFVLSPVLYAIAGPLLFPLFAKLFPKEEFVKL